MFWYIFSINHKATHNSDSDVNAFMSDHHICSCDDSPFIYKHAGHIVTVERLVAKLFKWS